MSKEAAEKVRVASEDQRLLEALRAGDETAFLTVVKRHHASMLRVAQLFVASAAVAEEVVQEAWLAVLRGLSSFEGRSSLRTWIFGIVTNCAKSRGVREKRTAPFSSFGEEEPEEPAVDPARFLGPNHPRWPGHWASPPQEWAEEKLLAQETVAMVRTAIEALPRGQRDVITLRDIESWDAGETCAALGVSEANQRVLLHRARSKVRAALEVHLGRREGVQ